MAVLAVVSLVPIPCSYPLFETDTMASPLGSQFAGNTVSSLSSVSLTSSLAPTGQDILNNSSNSTTTTTMITNRDEGEQQQQQPHNNCTDIASSEQQQQQQGMGTEPDSTAVSEDDQPIVDIIINNVVCSFNTRCHLNLKKIAMEGMHVEYRRENGVSCIYIYIKLIKFFPLHLADSVCLSSLFSPPPHNTFYFAIF